MTTTMEMPTMTDETTPQARARRRVVPGEPMDQRFETGFTKDDADAIIAYCTENRIKPAAFIRESTLAALRRRTARGTR